jgi:FMN reductase (NADPH)
MNPHIDLMTRHRSIRRFADAEVPDADVRAAVVAGQAASTSSAVQAYCVIQVRDAEQRRALVDLTGGQKKVAACGAFFVVCGDARRHRLAVQRNGRTYDARLEAFMLAVIDATLFAQNFVLAFESMGYGVCYIGGLRNQLADVDALLGLPEGVYPLYGLCVGVPAETPAARPRLPLEAVLMDGAYCDDDRLLAHLDAYDEVYAAYLRERGARPAAWSAMMAEKFAEARRTDLAAYYRGKGASLD